MLGTREMYSWKSMNRNHESSAKLNISERYRWYILVKVKGDKYKQQ